MIISPNKREMELYYDLKNKTKPKPKRTTNKQKNAKQTLNQPTLHACASAAKLRLICGRAGPGRADWGVYLLCLFVGSTTYCTVD